MHFWLSTIASSLCLSSSNMLSCVDKLDVNPYSLVLFDFAFQGPNLSSINNPLLQFAYRTFKLNRPVRLWMNRRFFLFYKRNNDCVSPYLRTFLVSPNNIKNFEKYCFHYCRYIFQECFWNIIGSRVFGSWFISMTIIVDSCAVLWTRKLSSSLILLELFL